MRRPASGPSVSATAMAVELHDGRAGQAGELAVQRRDLCPVARDLGVQRGDSGLQDIGPAAGLTSTGESAWRTRPGRLPAADLPGRSPDPSAGRRAAGRELDGARLPSHRSDPNGPRPVGRHCLPDTSCGRNGAPGPGGPGSGPHAGGPSGRGCDGRDGGGAARAGAREGGGADPRPRVRVRIMATAMKIRPSVMAAPVTWCAIHHWANCTGNQCARAVGERGAGADDQRPQQGVGPGGSADRLAGTRAAVDLHQREGGQAAEHSGGGARQFDREAGAVGDDGVDEQGTIEARSRPDAAAARGRSCGRRPGRCAGSRSARRR
jgi:hypothetical protein